MTLVEDVPSGSHVGELRLRRFRLGELTTADGAEIARHTGDCGPCRARLKTLEEEQRQFQREISFERFAGGVERARRVPRVMPRRAWTLGITGLAAAAAMMLVLRPSDPEGRNRIKGSTEATVRIGKLDASQQRAAAAGSLQALQPGDLVRVGFRAVEPSHLVAVSIDDAGTVTPIYPDSGKALPVEPRPDIQYLPGSIDFTGQGRERLILVLAERPLSVGQVEKAARAAHQSARGDLGALSSLKVDGGGRVEQFTWLFQKP
jgi:hypothetical protein